MRKCSVFKKINAYMTNQTPVKIAVICIVGILLTSMSFFEFNSTVQEVYKNEQRENRCDLISNISDSLKEFIQYSGNDLVSILYSNNLNKLFGELETNPEAVIKQLQTVVDKFPLVCNAVLISEKDGNLIGVSSDLTINPKDYVSYLNYDYKGLSEVFSKNMYGYELFLINKPPSSITYRSMESFCLAYNLISHSDGNSLGYLFLNFDRTRFRDTIGLSNLSVKENFLIINQRDQVVLQVGDYYSPEGISYQSVIRRYNDRHFKNHVGQAVEVFGGNEVNAPYKTVLSGMETPEVWQIYQGKIVPISVLLFGAGLVIVFIFILCVAQSRTIRKVKNILNEKDKIAINRTLIEDSASLEGMVSKQIVYSNMLEKQNDDYISAMKRKTLTQLFEARYTIDEKVEAQQFERMGIDISNSFGVLVFRPLNIKAILEQSAGEEREYELLRFVIENVLREYLSCEAVRIKHNIVCLCASQAPFEVDDLRKWARVIVEVCEKELTHSLVCGIGTVGIGISDLPQSYYRAKCALKVAQNGKEKICDYSSSKEVSNIKLSYSRVIEAKYNLINLLKSHEYQKAQEILEHLIDDLISDSEVSGDDMRLQIYETACAVVDNIGDSYEIDDQLIKDLYEKNRAMLYCRDASQLRIEALSLFESTVHIMTEQTASQDDFISTVTQIVEEEYANPDMSVAYIGEKIGRNSRTISAKFIKKTGRGLLDYIHSVRIAHAKKLLTTEEISVQEVAELVGYENANTFIRVFKRYCNITPGNYQEINKK